LRSIRCYVSPPPASRNKIADWYNDLSAQEKADADQFIQKMRKTVDWKMPLYRPRISGGSGLGELRWWSNNKQHRLIGFFMGYAWYAVMGCIHKQRVYSPPNALETARVRKQQIENDEVETLQYDL